MRGWRIPIVLLCCLGFSPAERVLGQTPDTAGESQPNLIIDPKTPAKELLPVPPTRRKVSGPLLTDDLTKVPEVEFQAPPIKGTTREQLLQQSAKTIFKMNHLNGRARDSFVSTLRAERLDLAGLPFAMGDSCRIIGEERWQFVAAVEAVRAALSATGIPSPAGLSVTENHVRAAQFWKEFTDSWYHNLYSHLPEVNHNILDGTKRGRIAALMQMLATESMEMRLGLVKYLAKVPHRDGAHALGRLALFSPEEEVRRAAVDALKNHRERNYTDVLLRGLRYPWPAVARRAAEAIVRLERKDLIPDLVGVLEKPDPRVPKLRKVGTKKEWVAHELVRVNHHKNCLLCHPPGKGPDVPEDLVETVVAAVPLPSDPLVPPSGGYGPSTDLLVRMDVTYLKQDFSLLQPVSEAHPWPDMQRFDFLVRKRVLTAQEAATYRAKLESLDPAQPSPYRRAALFALRELTGRDTAPTARAWRKLLGLPPANRRKMRLATSK